MKYCEKCGNELMDDAIICSNCNNPIKMAEKNDSSQINEKEKSSTTAIVFGVLGIIAGISTIATGYILSLISIIIGAKDCSKNKKATGLVLGIIGGSVSVIFTIIRVIGILVVNGLSFL